MCDGAQTVIAAWRQTLLAFQESAARLLSSADRQRRLQRGRKTMSKTLTSSMFNSRLPTFTSLRLAAVLAGVLVLSACASAPQAPNRSLQAAEQAIATAEQARVADYASLELSQAREKLAAARVAVQKEEMVIAERLADEALVEAQLATAKAGEAKAKKVNDDMKESTRTLILEMGRDAGNR